MKKVLIVMGSDSDLPILEPCFDVLDSFQVPYKAAVCSAHRTPDRASQLASSAEADGFGVVIAAAGLAAHLAGVMAAATVLPVIGLPVQGGALNGLDALLATVQMPAGVPVATVAINGATNAALLAVQIIAQGEPALREKLHAYKQSLADQVLAKDKRLNVLLKERTGCSD